MLYKKWKRHPKQYFDFFLIPLSGLLPVLIFIRLSSWGSLKLRDPLDYSADILQYGNWVANAQKGSVLFTHHLGAPLGQQLGLSAYGYEWIQAKFVSLFASYSSGPWLAMNRYLIFTYLLTGITTYLSIRWMRVTPLVALIGSLAFNGAIFHETFAVQEIHLGMLASIPPAIVLCIKILQGSTLENLLVSSKGVLTRRLINGSVVILISSLSFTGAFYYQMLLVILIASTVVLLLVRKMIRRAMRQLTYMIIMIIPLVIGYAPIIFARLNNQLGLSEPSTSDRRPFAVYANSGDLFSLFSPTSPNSLYYRLFSKVGEFKSFMTEYWSSPIINNSEYSIHPLGLALSFVIILYAIIFIIARWDRTNKGERISFEDAVKVSSTLLLISVIWFVRGGLGTFASFLFAYMRSYSRLTIVVLFISVMILCLCATASSWRASKLRWLALAMVSIVALDNWSATTKISQNSTVSMVKQVGQNELPGSSIGAQGFAVRTLGIQGTRRLTREATQKLPPNCSVLVLPLVSFPVDFHFGLVSYYGYETLKPGLEPSQINWSSGGIPGTPNNSYVDKWLPDYQEAKYGAFLPSISTAGFCGILMMRGLQDGFNLAGPGSGSKYGSGEDFTTLLIQRFGAPCYSDIDSAIDLYCLKKNRI